MEWTPCDRYQSRTLGMLATPLAPPAARSDPAKILQDALEATLSCVHLFSAVDRRHRLGVALHRYGHVSHRKR